MTIYSFLIGQVELAPLVLWSRLEAISSMSFRVWYFQVRFARKARAALHEDLTESLGRSNATHVLALPPPLASRYFPLPPRLQTSSVRRNTHRLAYRCILYRAFLRLVSRYFWQMVERGVHHRPYVGQTDTCINTFGQYLHLQLSCFIIFHLKAQYNLILTNRMLETKVEEKTIFKSE